MKKKIHSKYNIILIFLLYIIISIISDIFIYHTHVLFNGNDIQFHLRRMLEFKEALTHGNFLPIFGINYFHSFPVMGMYPYFILLPLIALFSVSSSYVLSYNLYFILITFISLIISYFSSLNFSRSKRVSYVFSLIFSLSSAILIDYFYDGDLGLATSLIFLPLVIFGFIGILNGSTNYLKLVLGIFLMSLCQLPATFIIIVFLILWLIINFKKINKLLLITLFKAGIVSLLLMAIVWVPLLEVEMTNKIITPGVTNGYLKPSNILGVIKNIGIIPFVFIFILLAKLNKLNKFYRQLYLISIIIVIFSTKIITFLPVGPLSKFQFTSRFLIIPQIFLSYLSAYLIVRILNKFISNYKALEIFVTLLVIVCQIFGQIYLLHKNFNSPYKIGNSYKAVKMYGFKHHYCLIKDNGIKYFATGYMKNDDYSTVSSKSKYKYINNNDAIYQNNKVIHMKHIGYDKFSFNNSKEIHRLALPLLHYNNEYLRVYLNHHLVHYCTNDNNLITLNDINRGKHQVYLKYVPNIWVIVLKSIMFFIGVIWIIILGIIELIKKN